MNITRERLMTVCRRMFARAGVPEEEAEIIAEVLVTTECWGVRSHGVMRLERYIDCILSGGIRPEATWSVEQEGVSWCCLDAQGSLGMVTSYKAMQLAIAKAKQSGIAIVTVNNSNHFGAAGYYSMMAAEAGMYGLAMCNVGKIMAVTGSAKKSIGNNPFSYAFPAGKHKAIMLDICMSQIADGKAQIARELGMELADGCMIDKYGRPTRRPEDYFNGGALLPFGGHKGYGLAVMVDGLAGILAGAAVLNGVSAWNKSPGATGTTGHCFIAIDIDKIISLSCFEAQVEQYIADLHAASRAEGVERIVVPGQLELEQAERCREHGIELLDHCADSLRHVAVRLGMAAEL